MLCPNFAKRSFSMATDILFQMLQDCRNRYDGFAGRHGSETKQVHVFRHDDVADPPYAEFLPRVTHAVDKHLLHGVMTEKRQATEAGDGQEVRMTVIVMATESTWHCFILYERCLCLDHGSAMDGHARKGQSTRILPVR